MQNFVRAAHSEKLSVPTFWVSWEIKRKIFSVERSTKDSDLSMVIKSGSVCDQAPREAPETIQSGTASMESWLALVVEHRPV
jgi:hypothetical protein